MKYWISEVGILHVFPELLKVFLLLCKLLLELQELLLLAHANSVVLTGLLALGECITVDRERMSCPGLPHRIGSLRTRKPPLLILELQCHRQTLLERWLRMQLGIEWKSVELDEQL
jgi:hypothetical protein